MTFTGYDKLTSSGEAPEPIELTLKREKNVG
jgi:hypothetical protein